MNAAKKILQGIFSGILAIVSIFGVPKSWATSDDVLKWISLLFASPIGRSIAGLIGFLLFTYLTAEILSERRLRKAQNRPPAKFAAWDKLQNLTIWQGALLWNGIEPASAAQAHSLIYPFLEKLKEDIEKGLIVDVNFAGADWLETRVSRQRWVDYAIKLGARPAFLFPYKRSLLFACWRRLFVEELTDAERGSYAAIFDFYYTMHQANPATNYEQVKSEIYSGLLSGKALGVARKSDGEILFSYEKIPTRKWKKLKIGYNDVTKLTGEKAYGEVKVLFRRNK